MLSPQLGKRPRVKMFGSISLDHTVKIMSYKKTLTEQLWLFTVTGIHLTRIVNELLSKRIVMR